MYFCSYINGPNWKGGWWAGLCKGSKKKGHVVTHLIWITWMVINVATGTLWWCQCAVFALEELCHYDTTCWDTALQWLLWSIRKVIIHSLYRLVDKCRAILKRSLDKKMCIWICLIWRNAISVSKLLDAKSEQTK